MTVRVYRSTDFGAPQLSGQVGTLLAILDACLVNGYGANTITSLTQSGGVATATTLVPHQYTNSPKVLIAGAGASEYNGEVTERRTGRHHERVPRTVEQVARRAEPLQIAQVGVQARNHAQAVLKDGVHVFRHRTPVNKRQRLHAHIQDQVVNQRVDGTPALTVAAGVEVPDVVAQPERRIPVLPRVPHIRPNRL